MGLEHAVVNMRALLCHAHGVVTACDWPRGGLNP